MNKSGMSHCGLAIEKRWQKRVFNVVFAVVVLSVLSACLESDKPLITADDGTQWFKDNEFYAMELNSSFVPKKKSSALRPEVTRYLYSNQSWQAHSGRSEFDRVEEQYTFSTSVASNLLFRSLSGANEEAVLVQRGNNSINYGFARRLGQEVPDLSAIYANTFDYIVVSSAISPLDEEVAKIRKSGFTIESKLRSGSLGTQQSYSIDSKDTLEAVAQLVKPRFLGYGDNLKKYSSVYLIAEKPETRSRMIAVANGIECLSRAGHRSDPALEHIKQYSIGSISIDDINLHEAKAVCEAAFSERGSLGELSNSVIYALARMKQKSGEFDDALNLLKMMKDDQSGLSVVAAVSIEATRAYRSGRSHKDALELLNDGLSKTKKGTIAEYNMLVSRGYLLSTQAKTNGTEGESRKIYRYLSENGHQFGKLLLARQLHQGVDGPKNISEARTLYLQLLENKMPEAYTDLGLAAYNGELGFVKNHAMAADLFSESLNIAPTAFAYYLKGFMQMYGQGVVQDTEKGFRNLYESHLRGRVTATTEVGLGTYHGRGTEKNTDKAIELLALASEKGDANATQHLNKLRETDPENFAGDK